MDQTVGLVKVEPSSRLEWPASQTGRESLGDQAAYEKQIGIGQFVGRSHELDRLIDDELVRLEHSLSQQLASPYPSVAQVMHSVAALSGKRLRPRLAFLAAQACGGVTADTRIVATVVEMVHTATLVHDDVLDNASTRRGQPASHVTWGNRSSILLGDILFSKAYTLATSARSCYAAARIGRAGQALCEGELRQHASVGNWNMSMSEYIDILRQKTGDLCAASSSLGAWSAGASAPWQQALESYGMHLGVAFQIFDDWLDVWGTAALGKPLANDLANRKPTLPTLRLLETTRPEHRHSLIVQLNAGQLTTELRQALDATDASAITLDTARSFAQSACEALSALPESAAKAALVAAAQQSVSRRR